jgi:hypothetical protein
MSELLPAFVSELVRATNNVDGLSRPEQVRLLRRAAATIRELRGQTGAEPPAEGDMVADLTAMADTIDLHGPKEVAAILQDAAAAIKIDQADLESARDAEHDDLVEEINNPDGTT